MIKSLNHLNVQAFDMFCSIGGLTYGLQKTEIHVKAGLDIDVSCRYAFETNCHATFIDSDIKDISYSVIAPYLEDADVRVLVGCAPCQPFSNHTVKLKSYQSDSRWNQIDEFLRIILEGKPEIVSMENVPRLINKPIYEKFKRTLNDAGYTVSDSVVNCSDYGVPQTRRRLVMFASLFGLIVMQKPKLKLAKSVKNTIGNLEPIEHGQSSKNDPLHTCSRLETINLNRIHASKPGGSWRDWPAELLPECYKKDSGLSYGSVYGRMVWILLRQL